MTLANRPEEGEKERAGVAMMRTFYPADRHQIPQPDLAATGSHFGWIRGRCPSCETAMNGPAIPGQSDGETQLTEIMCWS